MNNTVTYPPVTTYVTSSEERTCDYVLGDQDKSFVETITKIYGVYHVTFRDGSLITAEKYLSSSKGNCLTISNSEKWCSHYVFSNNNVKNTTLNSKNFEIIEKWYDDNAIRK